MNIISTRLHSRLDYLSGFLFAAMPWILGFNEVLTATWTPIVIGSIIIMMSLFTDYEGGMVRAIPMAIHLNLDIVMGIFLAASPWILGFSDKIFLPHLLLGLFEAVVGLTTVRVAKEEEENAFERTQQP